MVQIVERRESAPGDEYVLEFKVYLSPKDHVTVLGYVRPFGVIVDKSTAVWVKTDFGVPAAEAFRTALGLCERHGISTLLVNDPENRFPPDMRGVRAFGRSRRRCLRPREMV
jgi:hypothetical protein